MAHDCTCCGQAVYADNPLCEYCRTEGPCAPEAWHCDGRYGHECDGTMCEERERPVYDECGCIFPCPDHKTPAQDGQRDRDYWSDHYAE